MTRRRFGTVAVVALGLLAGHGCGGDGEPGSESGEAAPSLEPAPAFPEVAQALSLLGDSLFPPELPPDVRAGREQALDDALAALEVDPEGADALIWAGRRYAYLGEYRQAIQVFSLGIDLHPQDARFHRHRGHRYVTLREFESAIADFRRAEALVEGLPDVVEPDGQPNAMGIPTSTLHFNIWYHLGLAHYLKGEFEQASRAYRRCMEVSVHADSKVATAHWWYMTLRRLGQEAEADALIRAMDLDALEEEVIESGSYLRLLRMYAGEGSPDTQDPASLEGATMGYGIGAWRLYNGDPEGAREIFLSIVAARDQWPSFGYIAAEADLARMGEA